MAYGTGLGAGGAAAAGLASGFEMGLRSDAATDARKQRDFENQRQATADQQRADQITRSNTRQDKIDANAEDDRALSAANLQLEDSRFQLGALHQKYPDGNVPDTEAKPLYTAVGAAHDARQSIITKRYQPVIDATQQKWRDFASRAATGQVDPSQLQGQDLRDFIQATTGHPLSDFANGTVGRGVNDTTTGIQTKNPGLSLQGANALLAPQIKQGLGGIAPDGSTRIDQNLAALVPAPQPAAAAPTQSPVQGLAAALGAATAPPDSPAAAGAGNEPAPASPQPQPPAPAGDPGAPAPQDVAQVTAPETPPLSPGVDPNKVIPVLQVTTRQPDGRITTYHEPVTADRGSGDDSPLAQPLNASDLMDRMGRLGVVDNWLKTPEMAAKVQDALKSGAPTSFEQAWGMVHGDPKQLAGADSVAQKITAVKKLASDLGIPFADAMRQYEGKAVGPLQQRLDQIDSSLMTDDEKATARRVAYGIQKIAAPKAAGGTDLTPEAIDQVAAAALKDRTALIGIGRDPNKVTQVLNRMATLAPGGDIAGNRAAFGADKKSLDKIVPMYDAVTSFENNTLAQGKRLVDLAKEVDTTGIPVIERWIRAGRKNVAGDPAVSAFNAQLTVFGNEAAKILTNPNLVGVLTVEAQREVKNFLPDNATPQQIERVVNLLGQDFLTRQKSLEDQTAAITKRMADRIPAKAAGISGGTGIGNPGKVSPADQTARDSDAGRIMREELTTEQGRLAAATDPAAKARSQANIDAIQREITKLPATKTGTGLGAAPAPTAKSAKPATQFTEGQVYKDAKGNQARYSGGQWVPL